MIFIQTVDEQLINTQYITRIYCQQNPVSLKWYVGCHVAHNMGEKILCTGLEDAETAYLQMRSMVVSVKEVM